MTTTNPRNNFYDFQKITLENLKLEQEANLTGLATTNDVISGSGVSLDFPQEPVVFDTNSLSLAQSGYASVGTFDGRGILAAPVKMSDLSEGNQISVQLTNTRVGGAVSLVVTLIGKSFEDSLIYEHLEFNSNIEKISRYHFKEITNILFQNAYGNSNSIVDGFPCINTIGAVEENDDIVYSAGRVLITEASACKVSTDCILDSWTEAPDIIFRDYKVYDPGKSLDTVLAEAVGTSNDIDDLDINTTTASTRTFDEGASTELIYAQKFKMSGTNIQKVTLAIGLESGSDWSGNLVVGIVPLLTSNSGRTEFLPDNEIDFDPDVIPVEEVSYDKDYLENIGYSLTSTAKVIDFIFTSSQVSNPSLSRLEDGAYYAITIKRTGNTSTGTLFFDEAINSNSDVRKLSVFSNSRWTDIDNGTFWYKVWTDSVKISSGVAYSEGVRLPLLKTDLDSSGARAQVLTSGGYLVNTTEGASNYLVLGKDLKYSKEKTHPRTGDLQATVQEDIASFEFLEQADIEVELVSNPSTVVLANVKDNNPRGNPEITGELKYPGLAVGNTISIVNPPSDLLTQNVVGSLITPNVLKPQHKYRIISQSIVNEMYGDLDSDGDIDIDDANRIIELNGYSPYLSTTSSYTSLQQKAAIDSKEVSIIDILKADLDELDNYEISSDDLAAINNYITNGTAFPNGLSSFTRVVLKVEPILDAFEIYDSNAISTLEIHEIDEALTDPSNFSFSDSLSFSIEFVPTWHDEKLNVIDLRRFITKTFCDFTAGDLSADSGGSNNLLVPGNLLLQGNILSLNGSPHGLDYEKVNIEIELPGGNSEGEFNIFENYVVGKMKFSDGTFVSSSALNNNQIAFESSISSHVKNVSDYSDGYIDYDGYGPSVDEVIGTYIDHNTGMLRIRAYNVVYNNLFPEVRTRIIVSVSLKKSGFNNRVTYIGSTELASRLVQFSP